MTDRNIKDKIRDYLISEALKSFYPDEEVRCVFVQIPTIDGWDNTDREMISITGESSEKKIIIGKYMLREDILNEEEYLMALKLFGSLEHAEH